MLKTQGELNSMWEKIQNEIPRSAYIHVPFCHYRCPYCNFTVVAGRSDLEARYVDALLKEICGISQPVPLATLFFGGGTPTALSDQAWDRISKSLRERFFLQPRYEWTVEANPNDLTEQRLLFLRELGVTRLSIGGQSFRQPKLEALGRRHTPEQLHECIRNALKLFESVSVDLIYAAPGESLDDWRYDLESAIDSGVQHVSTYGLTIEKGAAFWSLNQKGLLPTVPEEIEVEMYFESIRRLERANLIQYEVSNFAQPGYESKHNQVYWDGRPWLAFGPGAARFVGGVRSVNHRSTNKYLERVEQGISPIAEEVQLDWGEWSRERFVFGMRKRSGIDWEEYQKVADPEVVADIRPRIEEHCQRGWMEVIESRVRLTVEGLTISDSLWSVYL